MRVIDRWTEDEKDVELVEFDGREYLVIGQLEAVPLFTGGEPLWRLGRRLATLAKEREGKDLVDAAHLRGRLLDELKYRRCWSDYAGAGQEGGFYHVEWDDIETALDAAFKPEAD